MRGRVGILPSVLIARPVLASSLPFTVPVCSQVPGLKSGLSSTISSAGPTTGRAMWQWWLIGIQTHLSSPQLTWFVFNTRVSCLHHENHARSRCAVSDTASQHSSHLAGRRAISGAQSRRPSVRPQLGAVSQWLGLGPAAVPGSQQSS